MTGLGIGCAICMMVFDVRSDVFATGCSHLYHHDCLSQWIKRYYVFLLNYIWSFVYYHMKMLLGDFTAKVGGKRIFEANNWTG